MSPTKHRNNWLYWLWDDLRAVFALLKVRETWVFLGVALSFSILGGVSLYYSTGLDVSLQLRHLQTISCASASNLQSAAIIIGGSAFLLAGIMALGELANYVDDRRRGRTNASSRNALVGTAIALVTGAGLLWLLVSICS